MPWITFALACAIAVLTSLGVTFIAFQHGIKAGRRAALVSIATLPFLAEAALATLHLQPEPSYGLRNARIVAQIYREAYKAVSPLGGEKEHPEGWYLRMGEEVPAKIETSVLPFATEGSGAQFLNYTGTPAATMRASIKDLPAEPIQVCTGACDGLAEIVDLKGAEGVVVADWRRVQDVAIGQPAPSLAMTTTMPSGLPVGRWCLTIGLALLATGGLLALSQHFQDRKKGRRAKTTAALPPKAKVKAKSR